MSASVEVVKETKVATGDFVWYELRTSDAKSALEFYKQVVGWEAMPSGNPGGVEYTLLAVSGVPVAGLMQITPEMGNMQPSWAGFIGVDDVDAHSAKVEAAGGKLLCPPMDIPTVGRFAPVTDPQGAHFLLFKGTRETPPERPAPGAAGTIGWNELSTIDDSAAWQFYSKTFGWTEDSQMEMGDHGTYRIFKTSDKPRMGGIMRLMPGGPPLPYWLYYFAVDEIGAAEQCIREKGGTIVLGPQAVPGNMYIVVGTDPQGAVFAVVGPKK